MDYLVSLAKTVLRRNGRAPSKTKLLPSALSASGTAPTSSPSPSAPASTSTALRAPAPSRPATAAPDPVQSPAPPPSRSVACQPWGPRLEKGKFQRPGRAVFARRARERDGEGIFLTDEGKIWEGERTPVASNRRSDRGPAPIEYCSKNRRPPSPIPGDRGAETPKQAEERREREGKRRRQVRRRLRVRGEILAKLRAVQGVAAACAGAADDVPYDEAAADAAAAVEAALESHGEASLETILGDKGWAKLLTSPIHDFEAESYVPPRVGQLSPRVQRDRQRAGVERGDQADGNRDHPEGQARNGRGGSASQGRASEDEEAEAPPPGTGAFRPLADPGEA
jgi:hypothetical protein